MKKSLLLLFAVAISSAIAQTNHYIGTTGLVTLAGTGMSLTVQQPSSGAANPANVDWAAFYCSVSCTVVEQTNCAVSGSPSGSWAGLPGNSSNPARMLLYTTSVAGCTIVQTTSVTAGQSFTRLLSSVVFGSSGQYTFTVLSMTGTAILTVSIGESQ